MFSWFHLVVCALSHFTEMISLNFFWIFVRQFIDLHFFVADYWSSVSFLYWYHSCLILFDPCSLRLESVQLIKQTALGWRPFTRLFSGSAVDELVTRVLRRHGPCLVPGYMGLPSVPCSVVTLRQGSASGSTAGYSDSGSLSHLWMGVIPRRAPAKVDPCVGGIHPDLWVAGIESQGCFRVYSLDWGLQIWLWRHR